MRGIRVWKRSPHVRGHEPSTPALRGTSPEPEEAVRDLLYQIRDAQDRIEDALPLPDATVAALRGAGYSTELVEAWRECMQGDGFRYLRHDTETALCALKEFTAEGIPAVPACRFIAIGMTAEDAGQVHAAGRTAEDALPYVNDARPSPDDWWDWPNYEVVPWIIAGVPVGRLWLYTRRCAPEEAVEWEGLGHRYALSEADLCDALCAGFSPEDVEEHAAAYAAAGLTIGDAARARLALRTPAPNASPRSASSDPWGTPVAGMDEPPF